MIKKHDHDDEEDGIVKIDPNGHKEDMEVSTAQLLAAIQELGGGVTGLMERVAALEDGQSQNNAQLRLIEYMFNTSEEKLPETTKSRYTE